MSISSSLKRSILCRILSSIEILVTVEVTDGLALMPVMSILELSEG